MTEQEPIKVAVVGQQGKSALVQTEDFKRYYVPSGKVKDGQIDQQTLDRAVPYGIAWEAYLGMDAITTESLARMLRQAGIYTVADLNEKDRQLIRIGTSLIGQAVRDAAAKAEKNPPRSNNVGKQ